MKRVLAAIIALAFAAPVSAGMLDIQTPSGVSILGGGGGGGGSQFFDNTFRICDDADTTKCFGFNAGGVTAGQTPIPFAPGGTTAAPTLTLTTASLFRTAANVGGTESFLAVTGTFPTSVSGGKGVDISMTEGTTPVTSSALAVTLTANAPSSGSAAIRGTATGNAVSGFNPITGFANVGVYGTATSGGGSGTQNVGVYGTATGASRRNWGVIGYQQQADANRGAGVVAVTVDVSTAAALIAQIGNSEPTVTQSVVQLNNGTAAAPIIVAQDNGTEVYRLGDNGAPWQKVGTKTLTDATATAFVRIAVPSNGRQGGIVEYCVDANDATLYQTRCGSVPFSLVNEGGTEACITGTASDADNTPTGTLTVTFDGTSAAADTCDLRANAASSLTETTLRINYTVRLFGNATTAVTPQ